MARAVAVVALVGAVVLLVRAETPFGVGNGTVPDVVDVDECTAVERIEERGLRWRFGSRAPVGGQPAACVSGEPLSVADPVLAQRPRPGTDLGEGGLVVLETDCTRERACSRLGRYDYGR